MTSTVTTAAMTREQLAEWLTLRGVPDNELEDNLIEFAGKTEDEMDEILEATHGWIA